MHETLPLQSREFGSGIPLIILHGLFGSMDNWQTLAKRFAAFYHVLTPDQRNHGRSPHSTEFNYGAMAADLYAFIREHRLGAVHLLGHSMGGKTAMRFALDYSELVLTLTVVDAAPRGYGRHHDHILDALTGLKLDQYTNRREVDGALSRALPDVALRQFLMKNLKREEDNRFGWKMDLPAIRNHYDEVNGAVDGKRPFKKPALFLRGTKSDYLREDDLPDVLRLFPQARMVAINAGHWIHAEAPDELFRAVMTFLREGEKSE